MNSMKDTIASTAGNTFLSPLIEQLGINNIYSKRILAGLVMDALRINDCGVTPENENEVKKRLIAGLCGAYEFSVIDLASRAGGDSLLDILFEHEPALKGMNKRSFYPGYIWPFISQNEVIPGVKLRWLP